MAYGNLNMWYIMQMLWHITGVYVRIQSFQSEYCKSLFDAYKFFTEHISNTL